MESSTANTKESGEEPQRPANISPRLWEKFQLLKNKRQDFSKRSRERNLRNVKKKKDVEKQEAKRKNEEETDNSKKTSQVKVYTVSDDPEKERSTEDMAGQSNWDGIRGFIDCNSHITTDHSKPGPKSGLEKKIDEAIELGDFSTAEKLSDRLSTREFGTKIAAAIDAREFTTKRKREDEMKKSKKRKKLHWGFEHKEKWEMKANM